MKNSMELDAAQLILFLQNQLTIISFISFISLLMNIYVAASWKAIVFQVVTRSIHWIPS